MKLRNTALNTLFYFLYMLVSCIAVMVVEALFVYILSRFVIIPYPVLTVIRIVLYSLGVPAIMATIGYFEGYREGYCSVAETVVSGTLAMLVHLLFAMLFKFQAFVAGSVRFTAGLLHNGWNITEDSLVNQTPYGLFLGMFLLYGCVYIATLGVARYFGAQRRIIDRAELRAGEENA